MKTVRGKAKIYKQFKADLRPYAPEESREAFEREQALIRYDRINQLYVAVTRAENALYLIASTAKGTTDEYIIDRFPTAISYGTLTAPQRMATIERTEERAISYPHKPQLQAEEEDSYTEPFISRQYGTFMHEAIYQMADFTIESATAAVDKAWNRYGAYLRPEDKATAHNALNALCGDKRWQEISRSGKIFREKAIYYNSALLFIDLYFLGDDSISVVDFKSGEPNGSRHAEYIEQVEGYMGALRSQYNLPVKGHIVYLHDGEVTINYLD
jgi:ATP-dependent exoDNAse (exonuclease V) beta subunit